MRNKPKRSIVPGLLLCFALQVLATGICNGTGNAFEDYRYVLVIDASGLNAQRPKDHRPEDFQEWVLPDSELVSIGIKGVTPDALRKGAGYDLIVDGEEPRWSARQIGQKLNCNKTLVHFDINESVLPVQIKGDGKVAGPAAVAAEVAANWRRMHPNDPLVLRGHSDGTYFVGQVFDMLSQSGIHVDLVIMESPRQGYDVWESRVNDNPDTKFISITCDWDLPREDQAGNKGLGVGRGYGDIKSPNHININLTGENLEHGFKSRLRDALGALGLFGKMVEAHSLPTKYDSNVKVRLRDAQTGTRGVDRTGNLGDVVCDVVKSFAAGDEQSSQTSSEDQDKHSDRSSAPPLASSPASPQLPTPDPVENRRLGAAPPRPSPTPMRNVPPPPPPPPPPDGIGGREAGEHRGNGTASPAPTPRIPDPPDYRGGHAPRSGQAPPASTPYPSSRSWEPRLSYRPPAYNALTRDKAPLFMTTYRAPDVHIPDMAKDVERLMAKISKQVAAQQRVDEMNRRTEQMRVLIAGDESSRGYRDRLKRDLDQRLKAQQALENVEVLIRELKAIENANRQASLQTNRQLEAMRRQGDIVVGVLPNRPAGLGGILLDSVASFDERVYGNVQSGTIDPVLGKFSLVFDGEEAFLPYGCFSDFISVLFAVYYGETDPGISIDPICDECEDMSVRYIGRTRNTLLGQVLFDADRLMKCYWLGQDNITGQPIRPSVPGFRNKFESYGRRGNLYPDSKVRFWFKPIEMKLRRAGRAVVFDEARIGLQTENLTHKDGSSIDPTDQQYADFFTDHYQQFADYEPLYQQLLEYAKMVSIAKWMKDSGVPLDWLFMSNIDRIPYVNTPEDTPSMHLENSYVGLEVRGGVDLRVTNSYEYDATFGVLVDKAIETGQIDLEMEQVSLYGGGWTALEGIPSFKLGDKTLTPIPVASLMKADGQESIAFQTDAAVRTHGRSGLQINRYYDPEKGEGAFGKGWDLLIPYHIQPCGTEKEAFLNVLLPKSMKIVDLVWGREEELTFCSKTKHDVAGYVPSDDESSRFDVLAILSDASFRLTDRLGNTFEFDPAGNLSDISFSRAHCIHYDYSYDNKVLRMTNGHSEVYFEYDHRTGLIASARLPGRGSIRYSYDDELRLNKVTGIEGGCIEWSYASDGSLENIAHSASNEGERVACR